MWSFSLSCGFVFFDRCQSSLPVWVQRDAEKPLAFRTTGQSRNVTLAPLNSMGLAGLGPRRARRYRHRLMRLYW